MPVSSRSPFSSSSLAVCPSSAFLFMLSLFPRSCVFHFHTPRGKAASPGNGSRQELSWKKATCPFSGLEYPAPLPLAPGCFCGYLLTSPRCTQSPGSFGGQLRVWGIRQQTEPTAFLALPFRSGLKARLITKKALRDLFQSPSAISSL